jgi:hypothetical protein
MRQTRHRAGTKCVFAVLLAGLVLPVVHGPVAATAMTAAKADSSGVPFGSIAPVNVMILADESGSMQEFPNEIAGEQQAAIQIVQEEWSPQSQVAIYGFGSAPDQRGALPQAAIDQYCPPTELTGQSARTELTHCAVEIKPRTAAQGYNTDFAAALTQALTMFKIHQPISRLPLVFILTDGQLDVGPNSPYSGWGSSGAAGNAVAQQLIINTSTGILHKLRSIGAEIWPVGFGQADKTELTLFAQGGAQNSCPPGSGANPRAAIIPPTVTGSAETEAIQSRLIGAFAEARCAAIGTSVWASLPPGGSVSKTFTISPLATLGSLVVDKGDPRVTVTYADSDGEFISDKGFTGQASGSKDGATYVLTGQLQSPLETLRLDNPPTGQWTVTFTSPPGVAAQMVGLSVVWQGEIQLEFINQKIGDPGHSYQLAVQPAVRSAPVPGGAFTGFTTRFAISWPNGQQTQVRARRTANGDFIAVVAIPPDAKGTAHVVATAAAIGVQGQAVTAFHVMPGGGLTVSLNIPPGTRVSPGGLVTAHGMIDTNGAPATSIVFSLSGLQDGVRATLASPRGVVQVASGNQPITVAIHFYKGTRLGPALGTIRWAPAGQDAVASSDWLAVDSLDVVVAYPPTPLSRQWWFWVTITALLGAIGSGSTALGRRWRQNKREEDEHNRRTAKLVPASTRYQVDSATPWRQSGRYAEAGQPSATSNGTGSIGETSRTMRPGWRLPWK